MCLQTGTQFGLMHQWSAGGLPSMKGSAQAQHNTRTSLDMRQLPATGHMWHTSQWGTPSQRLYLFTVWHEISIWMQAVWSCNKFTAMTPCLLTPHSPVTLRICDLESSTEGLLVPRQQLYWFSLELKTPSWKNELDAAQNLPLVWRPFY